MHFLTHGATDRGLARSRNEDAFLVDDIARVYAVADGLGGLPRGALASNLAISTLEDLLRAAPAGPIDYRRVFAAINERVQAEGSRVSEEIGIGTTLSVVQVLDGELHVGHVGDCAVTVFRGDAWTQVTTDHTMEQELRARLGPDSSVEIPEYFTHTLTRCIGQRGAIEVDIHRHPLRPGDRVLICSDGVSKTMSPAEVHAAVLAAERPEALVRSMIETANQRGGPDNVTVVALFTRG